MTHPLLFLSFASFVFSINEKGFSVQYHGKNHITFWHKDNPLGEGEYEPYQVKNKGDSDCGYLIINSIVMGNRFGEKAEEIKLSSQRPLERLPDKSIKVLHCIPSGKKTVIYSGETIKCLQ